MYDEGDGLSSSISHSKSCKSCAITHRCNRGRYLARLKVGVMMLTSGGVIGKSLGQGDFVSAGSQVRISAQVPHSSPPRTRDETAMESTTRRVPRRRRCLTTATLKFS